jgi:hypothetical protein
MSRPEKPERTKELPKIKNRRTKKAMLLVYFHCYQQTGKIFGIYPEATHQSVSQYPKARIGCTKLKSYKRISSSFVFGIYLILYLDMVKYLQKF